MITHRSGAIYTPNDTHTVHQYGLAAFRKHLPTASDDAERMVRVLTLSSKASLHSLRGYAEDWDGNGSTKPSHEAIENALARLPELYRAALATGGCWREPQISASESGEVSFEWWSQARKITMYFSAAGMEVLQVWGTNINTEMSHWPLEDVREFAAVWAWLYAE